jgi:CCR4-NOT transcription complex subunit 3
MKKVDEGVELFDDIWEKVYSADTQNQKEKYELDLKKEIKKLQRLRDQIKTWIGSSEVKDKDGLVEARKLIETKMEQFKVCEKETKTKTYSKEGLARAERLDPQEQAKVDTTTWIQEYIDRLSELVQDRDVEIEKLTSGKGKKQNKTQIEEFQHYIAQHKFHINKLEGIMRLVNNDVLDVEVVDPLKDDLDYYMDSHDDDEYQQAYDEDFFYEALGLDDLDVVNVDRVTQVPAPKTEEEDKSSGSKSTKSKKEKKVAPSVIPLKIGRALSSAKTETKEEEKEKTPSKLGRSGSGSSVGSNGPPLVPTPARAPPPPVAPGGASMAAILKREQQDQEKERQQKALQQVSTQRKEQMSLERSQLITSVSSEATTGIAEAAAAPATTGAIASARAATTTSPATGAHATATAYSRTAASTSSSTRSSEAATDAGADCVRETSEADPVRWNGRSQLWPWRAIAWQSKLKCRCIQP